MQEGGWKICTIAMGDEMLPYEAASRYMSTLTVDCPVT